MAPFQSAVVLLGRIAVLYVYSAYCYRPSSVVCRSVCHTSEPDRDAIWVEDSGGSRKPCIRWGSRSPHVKRQFWGGKWASRMHCKVRGHFVSSVQKRLNRSICRLRCGFGWAKGSTSSIVFARFRQSAPHPHPTGSVPPAKIHFCIVYYCVLYACLAL